MCEQIFQREECSKREAGKEQIFPPEKCSHRECENKKSAAIKVTTLQLDFPLTSEVNLFIQFR